MNNGNIDTLDGYPTIPGELSGQILSWCYRIVRQKGLGNIETADRMFALCRTMLLCTLLFLEQEYSNSRGPPSKYDIW